MSKTVRTQKEMTAEDAPKVGRRTPARRPSIRSQGRACVRAQGARRAGSPDKMEKVFSLLSIAILLAAWMLGSTRVEEIETRQLTRVAEEVQRFEKIEPDLYLGDRGEGRAPLHIALEKTPSYGGPLQVAVAVNQDAVIENVAIVSATDTSSYIAEIVGTGILEEYLGKRLEKFPEVDTVSGATLSSTAIIEGIRKGSARIGHASFGMEARRPEPPLRLGASDAVVVGLFALALLISAKNFPFQKKARWALILTSIALLGFGYACQFSIATCVILLSGLWTGGLASYSAMLCLLLAVAVLVFTRKNLFCATICPFGAAQDCLGAITRAKPPTLRPAWLRWLPRVAALLAIAGGLYFRSPASFSYEPFGIFFNFIGPTLLFGMTVLIILASLVFKRPWCVLLCPAGGIFEFIRFNMKWFGSTLKGEDK